MENPPEDPIDAREVDEALGLARQQLLDARDGNSHWTGRLSSSALSTATAISALAAFAKECDVSAEHPACLAIDKGLAWLDAAQNEDGGFGDTDRSPSNIASSFLGLAAWHLGDDPARRSESIGRLQAYIDSQGSWDALRARYGRDKTFVVPILSNCAVAGLVPWSQVASLPFELAAFPQRLYRFLSIPVVSYAIPALVAIGQARYHHAGTWNPFAWGIRAITRNKTLRVLQRMQPQSGGYLEATPLTSFVLMNLASIGHAGHPVSQRAVQFLLGSQLDDGSWPIDENLATWLTSLSINALANDDGYDLKQIVNKEDTRLIDWHLGCQHAIRHPFTGADPGGWGWTDLSGAVPDADDTPAAILALSRLQDRVAIDAESSAMIDRSCLMGVEWLLGLQNRDGGWPTFCRGWGKLPFDRSGSDLTAHALRAINAQRRESDRLQHRIEQATERGLRYLEKTQLADGSWLPLWFGNHDFPDDENRIYGTARVLLALQALGHTETLGYRRGCTFLVESQNADGGWGGGRSLTTWLDRQGLPNRHARSGQQITSSLEETGVAIEALTGSGFDTHRATIMEGVQFLCEAVKYGRCSQSWPIGFYFAKLWYHEQLYPLIFTVAALSRYRSNCVAVEKPDNRQRTMEPQE